MQPFRTRIAWVSLAVAVAIGGSALGTTPAHGQSINGLGQADQEFRACRQLMTLDTTICNNHNNEEDAQSP